MLPKISMRGSLAIAVAMGIAFQVGHFTEHAVQFGVWLAGVHSYAYISPVAKFFIHYLGTFFYPAAPVARQNLMGMEILHLIGNAIFLATIAGLFYFFRTKSVRWALYVEGFHLVEHLLLTSTAHVTNQALGFSTLFGYAETWGGHEFAVGYRVFWHFALNLVPSGLMMVPLMRRSQQEVPRLGALAPTSAMPLGGASA
jgi:hypothetical protein